jgi:hypothetical protein
MKGKPEGALEMYSLKRSGIVSQPAYSAVQRKPVTVSDRVRPLFFGCARQRLHQTHPNGTLKLYVRKSVEDIDMGFCSDVYLYNE